MLIEFVSDAFAMAPPGGGQGGEPQNPLVQFFPFIMIIVIFYFLLLRPQQKKAKEQDKLLKSLQKGDLVITTGGLFGKIVSLEDTTVILEIAPNVKVKWQRSQILGKQKSQESAPAPSKT